MRHIKIGNNKIKRVLAAGLVLALTLSLAACTEEDVALLDELLNESSSSDWNPDWEYDDMAYPDAGSSTGSASDEESGSFSMDQIPEYAGYSCVEVNDNMPFFSEADKQRTDAFETYSELDELGRCGVAYANVCQELQPTEKREEINKVKPAGWKTKRYEGLVEGDALYNRCHLIAFMLAGESANEKNLITGTRYLNVVGMLPFEFAVDDYIEETGNHVLYRVTPIFEGDNLIAEGVLMEAWSVEDGGDGICFNYFCYNVQPGIGIDYSNGKSWLDDSVIAYDNCSYSDIKAYKPD